jgi:hypothetical protein
MTRFTHREIEVARMPPATTEGPMGVADPWTWLATVNGTIVRGTSVEDVKRRIGSALDSDIQTNRDGRGWLRLDLFK